MSETKPKSKFERLFPFSNTKDHLCTIDTSGNESIEYLDVKIKILSHGIMQSFTRRPGDCDEFLGIARIASENYFQERKSPRTFWNRR